MRARALCAGWTENKVMELTEEQYEQWLDNPLVLNIEVLHDASND
ncbi:hypothetical protein [Acetivibrio cellulolyticus]|nr:hypothetical protein [Acetivibrio cellulolyticus]